MSSNYIASEQVTAGYAQLRLVRGTWEVLGGVRAGHTNQRYLTSLPVTGVAYTGRQFYTDSLPSLPLRYASNARQNPRAFYFGSTSRPSFFEPTCRQ